MDGWTCAWILYQNSLVYRFCIVACIYPFIKYSSFGFCAENLNFTCKNLKSTFQTGIYLPFISVLALFECLYSALELPDSSLEYNNTPNERQM